jgi:alkylated DNA repair dioxygenase AlkB
LLKAPKVQTAERDARNQTLALPDALVQYAPAFFSPELADALIAELIADTPWENHAVRIFGREIAAPRLSSWHGDPHCQYRYSNVCYTPKPWTPALSRVRAALSAAGVGDFNCVLANFYRSGLDSMGWHSDSEAELGRNPRIASLSFGALRRFCLRHRTRPELRHEVALTHGSLLVMAGTTQHFWQHALPKMARVGSPRVNLTFRSIQIV